MRYVPMTLVDDVDASVVVDLDGLVAVQQLESDGAAALPQPAHALHVRGIVQDQMVGPDLAVACLHVADVQEAVGEAVSEIIRRFRPAGEIREQPFLFARDSFRYSLAPPFKRPLAAYFLRRACS